MNLKKRNVKQSISLFVCSSNGADNQFLPNLFVDYIFINEDYIKEFVKGFVTSTFILNRSLRKSSMIQHFQVRHSSITFDLYIWAPFLLKYII